jgi:hypothetical protein
MSIIKLTLERWGYRQIEVKTEIVVDSFLIPVGCLIDTGWDILCKRETVLPVVVVRVQVHPLHGLVVYFMFIITHVYIFKFIKGRNTKVQSRGDRR